MQLSKLAFIALLAIPTTAQPTKRALLIGIDDYTASTLPPAGPKQHRGWPDLQGTANDVRILAEMLVLRYGFDRKNIITLTNQQATREEILRSIDQHLVRPARKGDVAVYYFAGHGAQVPNAASDEPDRLDESIVPADSRRGAADIRDKELRGRFNQILDRGAHLTLLLDHCHSGGGFRGVGKRPRGIAPAPPIVDRRNYGPRPDERGALVFASTQDRDSAWEARGDDGLMHGAFTWALIRAMRDAVAGESAQNTFLRAQARLRGETAYQSPAMLGRAEARQRPFLGAVRASGPPPNRHVVAVERVEPDGDVILQGGWAHGLAPGSELAPPEDRRSRLRVTQLLGLGRSVARMKSALPANIRSGTLLEVVGWAAPQGRPLRVWAPPATRDVGAKAVAGVDGIAFVDDSRDADYLLTGRLDQNYVRNRVEYAWARPLAGNSDRLASGFPPRTTWTSEPMQLRRDLVTLRRIHSWLTLTPPPGMETFYRLAVRDEKTRQLVRDATVIGNRLHSIVLRASEPLPAELTRRHYYVFVVDSHGNSRLVFPRTGSVENRFPIGKSAAATIDLGAPSAFRITRPYGIDTYFLLSTEEPLPDPSILEWDGMRARRALIATRWSIERVTYESIAAPSAPGRR
ncbi:MAG TPA: caspase family protein [Thermoanaerobaculia bacterium]|nr:caspase family protein [Thermoanaerobaculia bacterium]